MSIVEFLEDFNYLLGKDLLDELNKNNMTLFVEHIKKLNKAYSDLKKKYNQEFRLIRNNAAAHKNKNARYLAKLHTVLPINNLTEIGYNIGKFEYYFQEITNLILIEMSAQIKDNKNSS